MLRTNDRNDRPKPTCANPLALLVRDRLDALRLKPIEFCRRNDFDQGMLSKILSSVKGSVELETALRLAEGLHVSPEEILYLIGKEKCHLLLKRLYSNYSPANSKSD